VRWSAGAWRRSAWAAAFALAGSTGARANGAFPDEFVILFQPSAPSRILLGANFGMVISEDGGATWRYRCEPWIVSGSNAAINSGASVSFYNLAADGALLAQAIEVTRSADVACTWPAATGALDGQLISRSDPDIVYAAQVSTFGASSRLVMSAAGGALGTWQSGADRLIPTPDGTQARILAVDPADSDKVYLRLLRGVTDSIAVTSDGGKTYENPNPLSIDGRLSAFLRAGDGTVYAGTMDGALYVRPPSGGPFARQPSSGPKFRCLGQRPGATRIYACGDLLVDGANLFVSDDGARTFSPLMRFTDIQGPLTCPPVQSNCAAHWERIQGVLGLGRAADAGQTGGGTPPPAAMASHCSSLGPDATALLVLLTFSLRRARA